MILEGATRSPWSSIARGVAAVGAVGALYGLGMSCYMTWSSKVGKRRTRDRLLDLAAQMRPWRGDETVLDVGCGRGLMLIGAAQRLTTGTAVGIDLWRETDQSGNTPIATKRNAQIEGVDDRVTIEHGDARALKFGDACMDVVTSHWVIHNIELEADRTKALEEMVRVLRPDGVLVLADIAQVGAYEAFLHSRGFRQLRFISGGFESRVMGALSGGTFRPQAIVARR
ncbi:MAG: class I SAM-dependent methyltransferase [Gemmatimonadaceae bacterium]|nr:class I SAM-dependent methyltransferase [Gemmatimonadaceae bacterium]